MEFCIGSVADITHVLDLRERLVSVVGSLQEGEALVLDGGDVQRVDCAGIQLLASALLGFNKNSITWRWERVSPELKDAAKVLGLENCLNLEGSSPGL
ncbi:STAS domain-containing protein [Parasalinivibrio latis]|uniref:STAS domain-containing protein n=1 Tax=Parasalinivibrio latis TaxID=2952610 RepID=UPI0030E0FE1F